MKNNIIKWSLSTCMLLQIPAYANNFNHPTADVEPISHNNIQLSLDSLTPQMHQALDQNQGNYTLATYTQFKTSSNPKLNSIMFGKVQNSKVDSNTHIGSVKELSIKIENNVSNYGCKDFNLSIQEQNYKEEHNQNIFKITCREFKDDNTKLTLIPSNQPKVNHLLYSIQFEPRSSDDFNKNFNINVSPKNENLSIPNLFIQDAIHTKEAPDVIIFGDSLSDGGVRDKLINYNNINPDSKNKVYSQTITSKYTTYGHAVWPEYLGEFLGMPIKANNKNMLSLNSSADGKEEIIHNNSKGSEDTNLSSYVLNGTNYAQGSATTSCKSNGSDDYKNYLAKPIGPSHYEQPLKNSLIWAHDFKYINFLDIQRYWKNDCQVFNNDNSSMPDDQIDDYFSTLQNNQNLDKKVFVLYGGSNDFLSTLATDTSRNAIKSIYLYHLPKLINNLKDSAEPGKVILEPLIEFVNLKAKMAAYDQIKNIESIRSHDSNNQILVIGIPPFNPNNVKKIVTGNLINIFCHSQAVPENLIKTNPFLENLCQVHENFGVAQKSSNIQYLSDMILNAENQYNQQLQQKIYVLHDNGDNNITYVNDFINLYKNAFSNDKQSFNNVVTGTQIHFNPKNTQSFLNMVDFYSGKPGSGLWYLKNDALDQIKNNTHGQFFDYGLGHPTTEVHWLEAAMIYNYIQTS